MFTISVLLTTKRCKDHRLRLVVTAPFYAFSVIIFEPIKIQTFSAPQNDCLNLSFVKNILEIGRMARNGKKNGN